MNNYFKDGLLIKLVNGAKIPLQTGSYVTLIVVARGL